MNLSRSPDSATPTADPLADVVPYFDLPKFYPALFGAKFTASWLLRQRDANGLSDIIRWVGRTAFISRGEFAGWFKSRSTQAPRSSEQLAASRCNVAAARAAKGKKAAVGKTP